MRRLFAFSLFGFLTAACGSDRVASSLAGEGEAKELKVLTYNTYQLTADPNGKPTLDARRALLADALAATGADVLILQELWSTVARADLTSRLAALGYVGSAKEKKTLFPPYFYGNGLYVFVKSSLGSVAPAEMTIFASADMINFDFFTNKGAIKVRVDSPDLGPIDFVAAHSSYLAFDQDEQDFDRANEPKLLNQIRAIGELMNASPAPLQVLGADLNTHPTVWHPETKAFDPTEKSGVYKILTEELGLSDAAAETGCEPCYTWDNDNNELIRQGLFGGDKAEPNERIDYVMYRGAGVSAESTVLALLDNHVFGTGEQAKELPLSDHFAVMTTLKKVP